MKIGDSIKYLMTWPRGEPKSEVREGIIELLDGDYHAPEGSYARESSYRPNGKYLVLCTSCSHHRIDSVHPDQIINA